jgi:hypothetical protein
MSNVQPKMIPNPLWCETCHGRGYLVADAEWQPYAVQCADCKDRRNADRAVPRNRDASLDDAS